MNTHRVRVLVVLASASAVAALMTAGPASAAGGGYGGSSGSASTPTGFNTLVAAKSFGLAGGKLKVSTAGGTLQVSVPAGESAVQVAVTKGSASTVKKDLEKSLSTYKVISAFGVEVKKGAASASVSKGLTVTFTSKAIAKGDKVVVYSATAGKFVPLTGVTLKNGGITVHLKAGETIAVVKK